MKNTFQVFDGHDEPLPVNDYEIVRNDNYNDGSNIKRYDWWCPRCGTEVIGTAIGRCPICKQKLIWE